MSIALQLTIMCDSSPVNSFDGKWYGEKCVDHFIGMWAFAIWDEKKKELFLSRDPFGEKPLFYFFSEKGFTASVDIIIKCKKKTN